MPAAIKAMRPHQWVKNAFVLAALVFARKMFDVPSVLAALGAFAAFCLLASSVYLINDVADYERDRVHPKKRFRPIASGALSRRTASIMGAFLAPVALAGAWFINPATLAALCVYLTTNLAYSMRLKHVVLLDVFMIAFGFLVRVVTGAVAIEAGVSPWLLICTFFIALFLGLCKRRHELSSLGADAASHRGILGDYSLGFIDQMVGALAALTVMSYALYTIDATVIARLGTDALVLTVPLVLFGVFRYLWLVHLRDAGGSPTEVALTDRGIQFVVALWLGLVVALIYGEVTLGLLVA